MAVRASDTCGLLLRTVLYCTRKNIDWTEVSHHHCFVEANRHLFVVERQIFRRTLDGGETRVWLDLFFGSFPQQPRALRAHPLLGDEEKEKCTYDS